MRNYIILAAIVALFCYATPSVKAQKTVQSIAPMSQDLGKVNKDFAGDVWANFVKPFSSGKTGKTAKQGNAYTTSNAIINRIGGLVYIDLCAQFEQKDDNCVVTLTINVGSMVFSGQVYQEKTAGASAFLDEYVKLLKREVLKQQMRDQQTVLRNSVKKKAKNEREMARLTKSIEMLEQRIFNYQNTISDDKVNNEQLNAIIANQKEVLEAMQKALNADLPKV